MDESPFQGKICVIGIGYRPFDKKAKQIVTDAETILASERLFDVFRRYEEFEDVKDKVEVINNVDATMNFIKCQISRSEPQTVVLLASGDPFFYGIGRRAVEEFGKERVEIIPDLSSVQLAFSRIKESWDDAFLMSIHHGPDVRIRRKTEYGVGDIPSLLERHHKIAVLTDQENNPAKIAEELLGSSAMSHELSAITMYVCEKLGYPEERIIRGSPREISLGEFSQPNVVILLRRHPLRPSLPETPIDEASSGQGSG